MKLKKIFSLGLAAAMTASLLAGCGSGNPTSSTLFLWLRTDMTYARINEVDQISNLFPLRSVYT